MRRSPRLHQGIREPAGRSNDGPGTTAAPGSLPPQTPHHPKTGAALNELISSIESEWRMGLKIRRNDWSPHTSAKDDTANKVYGLIKLLFYSARPALDTAIGDFERSALGFAPEKRLELLHGILKSKTNSPISRASTPLNEPPKSLKDLQTSTNSQASRSARLYQDLTSNNGSHRTNAIDPGSPTEADEDVYYTPPSPTRSAVQRREEASPRFSSNPRKRPSESSNEPPGSPKLTKVSKGKQPAEAVDFKKPTPQMTRSFQRSNTTATAPSSANTSFNDSTFSSQQTQAESAATSFMTDGASDEIPTFNRFARRSSTSLDSLETDAAITTLRRTEIEQFELDKQREQDRIFSQGASRESNSKYGSVDDDMLLHETKKAEVASESTVHPSTNLLAAHVSSLPPPDNASNLAESPPRMPYYIRRLPEQNLFVESMPDDLRAFPFFILFICCRIAEAHGITIADLMSNLDPRGTAHLDASTFWPKLLAHPGIPKIAFRESRALWLAARKSFEGFSFKGKLVFSKKSAAKSVFSMELLPLQAETSCQLQRQYGSDRFLYLTVPPLYNNSKRPERFGAPQMQQIQDGFSLWLLKDHSFLGRKWRVFHIQPVKKKGEAKKDDADMRLVLFAISGYGIDTLSIGGMLNGFMPLKANEEQNYCKALARIDLGLSKTTPTLTFRPSQILRIRDTFSDGTPEATEFDDPDLPWGNQQIGRQVMNDGCSQISVGAALLIWKAYRKATGSDDPLPSAMQGRIGGAKGMWIISGEPQTRKKEDLDIWIEITDSQLKFEPPWEDRADNRTPNKHRMTFNLVKYSHATGPTDLHISFIPILVDRGVSKHTVAKLMTNRLDEERSELLEMLSDPVKLYNWITKQSASIGDVRWQAGLPLSLSDKVKHLLRCGFHPEEAPYLAYALARFLRQRQTWMEQKLRAPLGKATFMYGVTDPKGVLKPGEVHVQFSVPFTDSYTGNSFRNLNGVEALLARQPACRQSDIQKLRIVCQPELSHLVDVVVFPTRGEYPLAGKLQGGDYDGDIFWTCWEECLVEPFKNAPAPMSPLNPSRYGIATDSRKLREVMDTSDLSTADALLKEAFKFRTAPSLLGKATNFLEKVSYQQNVISSYEIDALCDVHDLLVDAAKQAYIFTENDYNNLVRFDLRCGNPKKPAYKEAMEASAKIKDNEGGKPDQKNIKHKPYNVLDFLFFEVFRAHNIKTMDQVDARLSKEEDNDSELQAPFRLLQNSASAHLTAELESLVSRFSSIRDKWNSSFATKSAMSSDQYSKTIEAVYDPFLALVPSSQNAWKPDIAPLLRSYSGPLHPTIWETIRASALYCTFPTKHSFVWHMAGKELARLKARSLPGTYDVAAPIFANLKPKPIKTPKPEDEDDEQPSEDEFESAMELVTG